jgi:valyl-tRNA synthetase
MDKNYDHLKYETDIYKKWEDSGAFTPKIDKSKKPFTIVMPPPNANDPLHVGHAMFVAIEDILIRYHRMKGDASLWLPGTDHAGIETQFVFEKKLAKQDQSRFDFDRETLYKMILDYVQENSGVAVNQMKRLGASADWSRFKFTLDPEVVDFVLDTFIKLHEDSLVYRGERLVNYCPRCGTSYSELEVEHEERTDPLYYVRYPLTDGLKNFVLVATTRPEPIWADTHLAVNPKDKKNNQLIGKRVLNPLTNAEMEIIGDEFVDPEFGTGVVKLTPAHDFNDFEVAQKHNLPLVQAIDTQGKMTGGPFMGMKVLEARKKTVEELGEKGLMEKTKTDYLHRVGTCYRCHGVLEPLPMPQFFIKTKPLAANALASLNNQQTKILGAGREKILRHWLENIRDWNISRQIVWGIRLPVWYSVSDNPDLEIRFKKNNETIAGKMSDLLKTYSQSEISNGLQSLRAPNNSKFVISKISPGENYLQETDTFDTWFSSGQWPVVTLKTNQPEDFDYFYPTTVLETGYDILPIWVMRMMLMGIYLTNETPFQYVYLHGLIRDEKGRKMSKSIGNVLNPLDMVEKYGADALRMALVISSTPGQDKAVGESAIRGMRNLSNKIWNASRFVKEFAGETSTNNEYETWLQNTVAQTTNHLENLRIGQAAELLYNEFWHGFCDIRIEEAKRGKISSAQLTEGLIFFLKMLHSFMPYVTEAVWGELKLGKKLLIEESWPELA